MPIHKDFDPDDVFRVYELARSGLSDTQICQAMKITKPVFAKWKKRHKLFKQALLRGRGVVVGGGGQKTFRDYVYGNLSDNLKQLWDEIVGLEKGEGGPGRTVDSILAGKGVRVKQQLFVHALIHCCFNPSEACRKINVSRGQLELWREDPYFVELINEIHWHKKNFFEGALVGLVAAGDTSAILFANRTFNRDRGYNDKVEVDHKHSHLHANVSLDELSLDVDTKRKILEAMRNKQRALPAPGGKPEDVIDAEITNEEEE